MLEAGYWFKDKAHNKVSIFAGEVISERNIADIGLKLGNGFGKRAAQPKPFINSVTLSGNISEFYQGDMILDPELKEYIKSGGNSRNAIRERKRLWTSRVIPYRIPSWMSMYTSIISRSRLLK